MRSAYRTHIHACTHQPNPRRNSNTPNTDPQPTAAAARGGLRTGGHGEDTGRHLQMEER